MLTFQYRFQRNILPSSHFGPEEHSARDVVNEARLCNSERYDSGEFPSIALYFAMNQTQHMLWPFLRLRPEFLEGEDISQEIRNCDAAVHRADIDADQMRQFRVNLQKLSRSTTTRRGHACFTYRSAGKQFAYQEADIAWDKVEFLRETCSRYLSPRINELQNIVEL